MRSSIALDLKISLKIGTSTESVNVVAAGDLVETDPTTHTDVDRNLFDKLPLESQSSSLSSLVTLASPGVSADSNGLFHGLGDHASNSFSVDGQPISDQQSKVFSNQVPLDSVQSMEVIEGAPPAEYGDKTSLVIVVTTRSGLGVTKPHGDITTSYGSFGSVNGGANLAYGGNNWGNFISLNGLNTSRFLDGPEFTVMHDHGNEQNVFDRLDLKLSGKDTINLNLGFSRSWFQTPNSFDAQNATAWSGLVVDNGGPGPQRTAGRRDGSGIEDQDLQHRSRLDASGEREYGVHVRRIRAPGSIQLLRKRGSLRRPDSGSSNQHHRPESQADQPGPSRQPIGCEGNPQHQAGRYVAGHDSDGKRQFRNRRSDLQRGVFECRREPEHGPVADQPGELRRRAASQSRLRSAAGAATT